MIKDTTLIAIYDSIQQVEMDCKLNTDTREVFDIKMPNIVNNFNYFMGFYFNVNGKLYPIVLKDNVKDNEYWHKQY